MLRICFLLMVLICGSAGAADSIRPVMSWDDYFQALKEEGQSDAEARAEIAESLESLRDMDRAAGADRVGVVAPPFNFDTWINSKALTLEHLRGKVVLVRWWTDTCPFCASSAPALRSLHEEYADQGLVVIGVFHPKAGRDDPLDVARVQRAVDARQFVFPVAIDWDWRKHTLKDWWLTGPKRPATSVTFLLDKQGIIRFVHPGMEYHEANGSQDHEICASDMSLIRASVKRLLAE
ncbi:MAG: redoxin domain-containing protein [Lysobacterales bacterium]